MIDEVADMEWVEEAEATVGGDGDLLPGEAEVGDDAIDEFQLLLFKL